MNLPAPSIRLDDCDELAALCKAGGDPLRLNVLRALANDSFGVLELARIFAIVQSGMSHHLKVLAQADLVATRREGNAIFYRRALPHTDLLGGKLHAALLEEVDNLTLPADVQSRIAQVHGQRAAASQDFFSRVADKFRAQQDLIAGLPQYRESVLALLDKLGFNPGATALDNSPAMLELARQLCAREHLGNVSLRLADALDDAGLQADCVVLNMVLHHFAAPADALKQMAGLLQPGGSLLVTDLCSHNQSWAREACGDLWLGFEQDDLARWATAAGLVPGESLYVGLRNGFQIQVRHFQRPSGDTHHR